MDTTINITCPSGIEIAIRISVPESASSDSVPKVEVVENERPVDSGNRPADPSQRPVDTGVRRPDPPQRPVDSGDRSTEPQRPEPTGYRPDPPERTPESIRSSQSLQSSGRVDAPAGKAAYDKSQANESENTDSTYYRNVRRPR